MIETFYAFGTRLGSREAPFKFTIHRNHEESNANDLGLEQTFFTDGPVWKGLVGVGVAWKRCRERPQILKGNEGT